MKRRVYFKPDGSVEIEALSPRYAGREHEAKTPYHLIGVERDILDESVVPWFHSDPQLESCEQIYHDGSKKLLVDYDWEECLMPKKCIIKRHEEQLNSELEAELAKPNPDPVVCIRKDRELKNLGKLTTNQVYELALSKLVAENKKPKIQAKLREKLGLE